MKFDVPDNCENLQYAVNFMEAFVWVDECHYLAHHHRLDVILDGEFEPNEKRVEAIGDMCDEFDVEYKNVRQESADEVLYEIDERIIVQL